ncbi:hypothetical protein B0T19DRAFT_469160 [Cercophora scortea]|uniref:DUF7907 domain-containing protein n=1 Tax=Cercophora scortea TaxID=314031 RepID=A0AAE0I2Z2_9PEZI|nr:hypothetical protein B0T19DRAFT_469160 [Cercophora scortea]
MILFLLLLPLAALSTSHPLHPTLHRKSPTTPSTTLQWTQAFTLIANVTNPSLDLNPSINHFQLTGIHIGAGLSTAVLTATTGRILYENGTGTPQTTGIASDLGGVYPYSLTITPLPADEPDADYVDYVGIDIGTAQDGIGVDSISGGGEWPALFGPERGTFVVCYEEKPAYGRPQYPVRFARERVVDGVAYQQIPLGCAPIVLVPQCAELEAVEPGAVYNHDFVRSVRCFEDVGGG